MKLIQLFAAVTVIMASVSCSKDNDMAPAPTLTVTEKNTGTINNDVTISKGDILDFSWTALRVGSGADLESFTLTQSGVNVVSPLPATSLGEMLPIEDMPSDYDVEYSDGIRITASSNIGFTQYTFKVTDKNGMTASRTISVEVIADETPFTNTQNGEFYHVGGSLQGAYSLIDDTNIPASGSDSKKDLVNTDAAGDAFTGSWSTASGAEFVKASGFDYANATQESTSQAFNQGTKTTTVTNPQVNDIYLIKLSNGNIIPLKVTALDPADNSCNCGNTGKISFEYKK